MPIGLLYATPHTSPHHYKMPQSKTSPFYRSEKLIGRRSQHAKVNTSGTFNGTFDQLCYIGSGSSPRRREQLTVGTGHSGPTSLAGVGVHGAILSKQCRGHLPANSHARRRRENAVHFEWAYAELREARWAALAAVRKLLPSATAYGRISCAWLWMPSRMAL